LAEAGRHAHVYGAEPASGNDAARSLREGRIVVNEQEPKTIADGARTVSLGVRNWAILKDGLTGIVEVGEEQIVDALRLLFYKANLKVEPTGALAVGALLAAPELFAERTVCCIISGGNVDAETYANLLLEKV
jgi:threonine dehydratase